MRTGCQWNALPAQFGDDSSVHRWFQRWCELGVMERIWAALVKGCEELKQVHWDWQSADGCMGKARHGGDKVGKNPTDRGKNGTKRSVVVDEEGGPLGVVIDGANRNDAVLQRTTTVARVRGGGAAGSRRPLRQQAVEGRMPGHDIIVVGASAGGMEALAEVARGLPADLPAAVFVVWHLAPGSLGVLPRVLGEAGPLPAANAADGEEVRPGRVYVAPPDRHLVLEPGRVRVTRGPRENRFRPAVDPLFRSAALASGPRVVGVVLTGALDDGTAGLWAVKARGGVAVVQDPAEATFPWMPRSALAHVRVDHVLPLAHIPPLLARLARGGPAPAEGSPVPEQMGVEARIALGDNALQAGVMGLGPPSPYTCPECHGTLLQMKTGGLLRFRCHTGHAYTLSSLLAE